MSESELIAAICEFVVAWDALPQGYHDPRAVERWLNSAEMKLSVKRLKEIAKSTYPPTPCDDDFSCTGACRKGEHS
jgi:hypothetical protein